MVNSSPNVLWTDIVAQKCFTDSFLYGFWMCFNSNNLDTSECEIFLKNIWNEFMIAWGKNEGKE